MELFSTLFKILTGTSEQAMPNPKTYESYDGIQFDGPDDLEAYEEEKALKEAKYILEDDPVYGTLYWSGQGRKPKWVEDYENKGGRLEALEVKRHEM